VFTTLERVLDSSVCRAHLRIEKDPKHGLRGLTTKAEFLKGFTKLVADVALGRQSSRSLNSNEDIRRYFESLDGADRVGRKTGSFTPADVIKGGVAARPKQVKIAEAPIKSRPLI